MEKVFRPEIVVSSFCDKEVHGYIERLEEIQQAFGPQQPILVHIDSYGGEVFGLFMLYEHLISMGNPILTYTSSKAMSAGCYLLAMAGTPGMRFASPNSTIMIHEIQSGAFGDMKELEQQMGSLTVLNDRLLGLFAKSIGLKSAGEVRSLIKSKSVGHDLTLTPQEAKELKIIDEIAYIKVHPIMKFDFEVMMPKQDRKKKGNKKNV